MMIPILNNAALLKMKITGNLLAEVFVLIAPKVIVGVSTLELDSLIERELDAGNLLPD